MEPTEDRIVANIEALPSILSDIIEAGGRTVREYSHILNTGKRYKMVKSDAYTKNKPQKRDRKETLVLRPCHPDLQPALDKLLSGAFSDAAINQVSTEIDTAATLVSKKAVRGDDSNVEESDEEISDDEVTIFLIFFF
jgi:hypothetical protein